MKLIIPKDFGKNFQKLRLEAGFDNQKDLAKSIGVRETTIGMWERSERLPRPIYWRKLIIKLRCTLDELFKPIIKDIKIKTEDIKIADLIRRLRNICRENENIYMVDGVFKTIEQSQERAKREGGWGA